MATTCWHLHVVALDAKSPSSVHSLWSSHFLELTFLGSPLKATIIPAAHARFPSSQLSIKILQFSSQWKQPVFSVETVGGLLCLWRVLVMDIWTVVKSAVFLLIMAARPETDSEKYSIYNVWIVIYSNWEWNRKITRYRISDFHDLSSKLQKKICQKYFTLHAMNTMNISIKLKINEPFHNIAVVRIHL